MHIALQLLIGALACVLFAMLVRSLFAGLRALNVYALSLVVTALIYVMFAVRGGACSAQLGLELAGLVLFTLLAVLGRRTPVFLVVGWAGHSLWDLDSAQADGWNGSPLLVSAYLPELRAGAGRIHLLGIQKACSNLSATVIQRERTVRTHK
jgi:hypothetical protein